MKINRQVFEAFAQEVKRVTEYGDKRVNYGNFIVIPFSYPLPKQNEKIIKNIEYDSFDIEPE